MIHLVNICSIEEAGRCPCVRRLSNGLKLKVIGEAEEGEHEMGSVLEEGGHETSPSFLMHISGHLHSSSKSIVSGALLPSLDLATTGTATSGATPTGLSPSVGRPSSNGR
ncbi:unnamed protein product [Lactuca virosa]|uniref:Uncharacterized protein n=1 Tax=Lactuca virosa TaxID=75947 RepID=A0AAU9NUE4_9ASTR|nr:unnamed protein product [Lactuca virosa]